MSQRIRKKHTDAFKFKVALAAAKGDRTIAEISQMFSVVASQIYAWKKQLETEGSAIFADKRRKEHQQENVDKLHRIIGKLTVERDFLSRVFNQSK